MTMTLAHLHADALNSEHRASVGRLDDDLLAVMRATSDDGDVDDRLPLLRRRIIHAYREALTYAAGRPFDGAWRTFALAVSSFVAQIPDRPSLRFADSAARRLLALADESADIG
jgi:hypothetical protein